MQEKEYERCKTESCFRWWNRYKKILIHLKLNQDFENLNVRFVIAKFLGENIK